MPSPADSSAEASPGRPPRQYRYSSHPDSRADPTDRVTRINLRQYRHSSHPDSRAAAPHTAAAPLVTRDDFTPSQDLMIGFLAFQVNLAPPDSANARGALLITDLRGDPMEFQAATPIRPSRVQQAIWGDMLTRHIVADLLAAPLLEHMQHSPSLVLCERLEALLAPSRIPIAHLHPHSEAPQPEFPHIQSPARLEAGCLTVAPDSGESHLQQAEDFLGKAKPSFDPFDAFDRIHLALAELAAIDEEYA